MSQATAPREIDLTALALAGIPVMDRKLTDA